MTTDEINAIEYKFGDEWLDAGGEMRYDCPFCQKRRGKADKDHKMYVNKKTTAFFCFKCGAKGRVIDTRQLQNSAKIYDILNKMFLKGDNSFADDDDTEDNMFYVPSHKITEGTVAYEYCINRGITPDKIKYYDLRLGTDDLFGRIVIPNQVYGDRGIWTDMFSSRTYTNQIPKYKNPSGVKKTDVVFNLHRIKENCDRLIIVEGAITAICAGKDAVALYGCRPSDEQINKIIDKNPMSIYCVLDGDPAGKAGNEQLLNKLTNIYTGKLYYVDMPNGIDAADMGEDRFNEFVEANKIQYIGNVYKTIFSYFNGKN